MDNLRDDVTTPSDLEALRRDLAAARRERAASAAVLRIVGRCGADAAPVFDAILEACLSLYSPYGAAIYLVDGAFVKGVARRGFSDGDWGSDASPLAGSHTGQALAERRPVHIEDLADLPQLPEAKRATVRAYGGLTTIYVPMVSGERGVGSLVVARRPKQPFSDAEIASLSAFADQAVIAIDNARLFRETQEAAAQQTATADVLKAINRSALDADAVLETLINAGVALSGSSNGLIWRYQDGLMHVRAAARGESRDDFVAHMRAHPQAAGRASAVARVAATGEIQNIPDMQADFGFPPELRARVQTRATLAVPMKRGDDLVGAIVMSKPQAGAYPERIVELVKTFADQAVIAIENARLFGQVQARTREVEEALAQQTATADVLKVISRSAFDLKAVLDTLTVSATRLCEGECAAIFQRRGDFLHFASSYGLSEDFMAFAQANPVPAFGSDSAIQRSLRDGRTVHLHDALEDPDYNSPGHQSRAGFRTVLAVPMFREGEPIGGFSIMRRQVKPFNARQIELVQTFADQAVIAIQNTRLFDEVQARTREVEESLAQQTATADVLKAISRSAFDLQTVLETLVRSATELCGAQRGSIFLRDGDLFRYRASSNADEFPEWIEHLKTHPQSAGSGSGIGRAILTADAVCVPDILADPGIVIRGSLANIRAVLAVPLLRDGKVEGVVALSRPTPGPFTAGQIDLVRTFADQAVIAIENARLFEEVQARTREVEEALAQQTATADVLKVISRSPSDLKPVLDAIADTAARLCGSDMTMFFRYDGERFRILSSWNFPPDVRAMLEAAAPAPGHPSALGRAGASLKPVYIPDVTADPDYGLKTEQSKARYRATLAVPMLREGQLIGALSLNRAEPGSFTQKHIELVSTFADQAAIAFENVRLFEEVRARTREIEEALARQTATAEILRTIAQSPSDVRPVFDRIATTAARHLRCDFAFVILTDRRHWWSEAAAAPDGVVPFQLENRQAVDPQADFPSRAIAACEEVHLPDWSLVALPETERVIQENLGVRSSLYLPFVREGVCVGLLTLASRQAHAFSEAGIALAKSLRDQALIAIENTRLFNETQEALAQQTATADVLKTISRSVFDLDAVLQTLIDTAVRLARGSRGTIFMRDGDVLRARAFHSQVPAALKDYLIANPIPLDDSEPIAQAVREGRLVHVPDMSVYDTERVRETKTRAGFGAALWVPLMRDGEAIGLFGVPREETVEFNEREIELVRTFADQAVIAIENARLFGEVQAKTRDLTEALVYQTGGANILKVIAASPTEVAPVLQAIVETACEVCGAYDAAVILKEGDFGRFVAHRGSIPLGMAGQPLNRGWVGGRAIIDRTAVHVVDLLAESAEFPMGQEMAARMGHRTILAVPLMRVDESIGAIVVRRHEAQAFTDKQIEVLRSFADQAVIAIGNVRLFDEVQARTRDVEASLQRQTAMAEILEVISSSPTDAKPVFDAISLTAARLFGCGMAGAFRVSGDTLFAVTAASPERLFRDEELSPPLPIDPVANFPSRAVVARTTIRGDYTGPDTPPHELFIRDRYGMQSAVFLPLLRAQECIGVFILMADRSDAFSAADVALAESFRDQALIAVENARLFNETQEALAQQTATADVLQTISRSAFDLQTVLETLISTAVELNEAETGTVCVRDGDVFRYRAFRASEGANSLPRHLADNPIRPDRGTIAGRAILSGQIEQIPDILEDREFRVPMTALGNPSRALVAAPLIGKAGIEGALVLARREPGLCSPRQIEILKTFADQAVIAIENARLLAEVQARTREVEQSLVDLRKAQDRLVQSEKLASLGQLTAGIAHEIKNPLNFVNNFASLSRELLEELRETLEALPETARADADDLMGLIDSNLEKVASHGKRADSIVKNMLLHSREGSGERARVDINAMVEEALNLAYHGARAEKPGFNVTLEKAFDPKAGEAELYLQEVTRVLINLISNGFYATGKRRESEGPGYEPRLTASTRDAGERVEIRIRDNGPGIPDDIRAKMFNPFFTTKPAGEGTGLGLSLSHDIVVKQHGGGIEVETRPGAFTEFVVTLPRGGV